MARYLLPEGLDLAELLPDAKPLFRHYCGVLISLIVERTGSKISRDKQGTPYVRIHSDTLRKAIPVRQLAAALAALKRLRIIRTDGKYSSGKYAKGYRLVPPWDRRPIKSIQVSGKPAERLEKVRAEQVYPKLPIHFALVGHLKRLEIDKDAAQQLAAEIDAKSRKKRLPFYNAAISLLADKIWLFKPDRSGRCHTNFTICPRKIRPFVTYAGKPLVKVDISAAQAFILPQIYRRGENFLHTHTNYQSNLFHTPNPMLCISGEVREFLDLVCWDNFYTVWQIEGGYPQRKAAKKAFVAFLNNTTDGRYFREEALLFAGLFPTLSKFHNSFWGKTTRGGKSLLSYFLQKEEAEWMIEGVCGRLFAANPDIPLVPVHDCIGTTDEFVPLVFQTIKDVAIERYGVAPHLKIDD